MNTLINNQQLFKSSMGNYPTGVTVVTTTTEEGIPVGLTVNSFASVSLEPLLILWSIDHKVSSIKEFVEGGKFAVHVLGADQADICMTFASRIEDRFGQCDWEFSKNGLPNIKGVLALLECKTYKTVKAGDHTILIGEVINIKMEQGEPLLYHRRQFGAIPPQFYPEK